MARYQILASKQRLIGFLFILWSQSRLRLSLVACNPLLFDPAGAPPMLAMPMAAPFMLGGPQMGAYAASPLQGQLNPYLFAASPFAANPMAAYEQENRRSQATSGSSSGITSKLKKPAQNQASSSDSSEPDEKKALDDLPLSFLDPDPPSSITERLSESFSAIGEGFRNHFRSLSENFSDTMDDIKDAWRSTDSSRKRG